jgi:uncharacterized membrane protein
MPSVPRPFPAQWPYWLPDSLPRRLILLVFTSIGVLFGCSSLRHALFQSGIYDLGWFDQSLYLISVGQPPIVSAVGFHVLGDHTAWILYPLALFYKIYATVQWLFLIQAIALASGAIPCYGLARQAGLSLTQAYTMAIVYLLYPLVFNVNLFDFHPEVIALPLLLAAILAARGNRRGWFALCIVLISGCKAVLSLTLAAMGLWLWLKEGKRGYGLLSFGWGLVWFGLATQVIMPALAGYEANALGRYAYLGSSLREILLNLVLKPGVVWPRILSVETLVYGLLLTLPLLWGLSFRQLGALWPTLPMVVMNILAEPAAQRDLVHQYAIPILPFLLVAVIDSWAQGQTWLKRPRRIVLWSFVAWLLLAKFGYFGSIYLHTLDTWSASQRAIAQVTSREPVLTTHAIAAHLAHRQRIEFTNAGRPPADLNGFRYVLLNLKHPGFLSNPDFAQRLQQQLSQNRNFQLQYNENQVMLYVSTVPLPQNRQ